MHSRLHPTETGLRRHGMTKMQAKEIRLKSRPQGEPTLDNFELATTELRELNAGEVLVRNAFFSVDPYMRGRMNDAKSYVPPFAIGKALDGAAIGQVVQSLNADFPV